MSWINNGKYEAQSEYDYYMTVQVKLKFNRKTDEDILEWIQKQKEDPVTSVQGSIKRLIREDIKKSN
jgi:hypothetical protein